MTDFFLVSAIINTIWQIFTILFVLYKFTSFFSTIYNFILFLGRLFTRIKYVFEQISMYITKKRGYSFFHQNELSELPSQRRSWFSKLRSRDNDTKPFYETRTSFVSSQFNVDLENAMTNQTNHRRSKSQPSIHELQLSESLQNVNLNHVTENNEQLNNKNLPFNAKNSNMLLNSDFMFNIFKSNKNTYENTYENIYENIDIDDNTNELKKALLNSEMD